MALERLVFRLHAVQRMVARRIGVEDVRQVLTDGETIKEYADDTPYSSRLVLGWIGVRPLHVVAADNPAAGETIVITVYEPDPAHWEPDFKRKRP